MFLTALEQSFLDNVINKTFEKIAEIQKANPELSADEVIQLAREELCHNNQNSINNKNNLSDQLKGESNVLNCT